MKKIFFPNLDGLRFVAFFMVYLWHAFKDAFTGLHIQNIYINNLFYTFANGKTGVSIFFVLSGFLITYLILSEIALNGKLDVKRFYIRRSLRIWPLYYLILLVIFVIIPIVIRMMHLDWAKYDMQPFYYLVYLSNFDVLRIYQHGGNDFLPSTVTWSVAIEEQFYFIWPLFFFIFNPRHFKYIFP
ncbi:MAG: acyltransferase, partial [Chitinophagaceae bacterium]